VCVILSLFLDKRTGEYVILKNVLIYTHDSLTQMAITTLLIIFPRQLCTGGKHQTQHVLFLVTMTTVVVMKTKMYVLQVDVSYCQF